MRLKTKLVLAITALVLLISGLLSLVYVSQLLHASVRESYDTNRMVANQVYFALRKALEAGLKDRKFDPGKPDELRELAAQAVRNSDALQAVLDSVNRYSLTVYDINIGDNKMRTLLSTLPENQDKPLPPRPEYNQLLTADPHVSAIGDCARYPSAHHPGAVRSIHQTLKCADIRGVET